MRYGEMKFLRFLWLLLVLVIAPREAAAGGSVLHLDPSFGSGGIATTSASGGKAVARQSDGRFVVGGTSGEDCVLHRFDQQGLLDPSFGSGGTVTLDMSGGEDVLWAVAIQPDGKILAVGESAVLGWPTLAVARVDPNGALDPTFGTGGIVLSVRMKPYDVAIRSDGTIVLAGYTAVPLASGGSRSAISLARLTASGSLDPTFGDGGAVEILAAQGRQLWGLALQSDGKIVAAGEDGDSVGVKGFLVVRFESDGSLDTTFGNDGSTVTQLSLHQDTAYDVVIQSDGKIVLGGIWYPGARSGFGLARYLPNGTLDPTFGDGGLVRMDFVGGNKPASTLGGGGYGRALALMPDDRIVLAGDFAVARFLPDGSRDPSFGGGSIGILLAGSAIPVHHGVLVEPDGKVVTVGDVVDGSGGAILARYAPCECGPCEACDETLGCVVAPQPSCRWAATTSIDLRDDSDPSRDSVSWKWSRGQETPANALGWPYETTDFAFCVYDESFVNPTVVFSATLPAGLECGDDRCWRLGGGGTQARYSDNYESIGGIRSARVKTGLLTKASASVRGKGAALGLSSLPSGLQTRVQLQAENGECWEAVYYADTVLLNGDGRFRASD